MKKINKDMKLPWKCPQHPNAQILHSWDVTHTAGWSDGYPRGGNISNHKYECSECGLELAATEEKR